MSLRPERIRTLAEKRKDWGIMNLEITLINLSLKLINFVNTLIYVFTK